MASDSVVALAAVAPAVRTASAARAAAIDLVVLRMGNSRIGGGAAARAAAPPGRGRSGARRGDVAGDQHVVRAGAGGVGVDDAPHDLVADVAADDGQRAV